MKERGLVLNTLADNRSFRPLPSAANAGLKSREHSKVLHEPLSHKMHTECQSHSEEKE